MRDTTFVASTWHSSRASAEVTCPEGAELDGPLGCAIQGECTLEDNEGCADGQMFCCERLSIKYEYEMLNAEAEGTEEDAKWRSLLTEVRRRGRGGLVLE